MSVTYRYAEMIAARLLEASKNAAYTHKTRPLAEGILKNLAVLRGQIEKPENTSLGSREFLDTQVEWGKARLEIIAKNHT